MAPPNNAAAIRGVEIRRTTVNQPPGPQEPIPPPVEPVAPAVQPDPAVQPAPAVPPAPAVQSAPADQPAPDAIPANPSQAGSNCLIKLQLDMAESIVGIIERISRPLRQTMGFFLSYPIKFADNVMLIILLIVEEMVPAITLPSDQLLENAKQFIRNSPMKYCIHCIQVLARLLPSRRSLMNEDAQEFHYQNENNEQEGINPQVLQDLLDAVEEQQQNVTLNISVTTQNANGSAA
ncbi:hypothetical protein C0J52_09846 [Blattella germanica]|nr:hypothetical protein C0J52_09846 [Blattella germanica]